MAYSAKTWSERVQSRIDVCSQISHLTRAASIDGKPHSALQIIIKILRERRIEPSTTESGFIVGDTPAVCFHDAPLYSICQNIEFERKLARETGAKKHRYEPVGLSFPKPYVYGCGARPVFYEKTDVAGGLLPADQCGGLLISIYPIRRISSTGHTRGNGDFRARSTSTSSTLPCLCQTLGSLRTFSA